jgi:microsomal dipeptidase-like Zn-dependent dipeptidase
LILNFNNRNLVVDIAHLSEKSIKDLDKIYNGIIINSHANVNNIYNSSQNLFDNEIQIIVDR